jgi:pyruvate dehydrogenase E1 component alpha subunit
MPVNLDEQSAKGMLREMYRIRMIEQAIASRYQDQEMRCPVHLSIGQESIPVAVSTVLRNSDLVVSAHRSHAHYLAKGGDLKAMLAELYGKATGCARGRGGSMHLVDAEAGLVAAVPIVGSAISIGVGVAWGKKLQGDDCIVVVYIGDGATEQGTFTESLDFALLHGLRVLFVVENNYYSVYTHVRARQSPLRTITGVARGHGVEALAGDGNDAIATMRMVVEAVRTIREDSRPILLEFYTYRWLEHCGPNRDDHLDYRDTQEVAQWIANDPITRLQSVLVDRGWLDEIELASDLEIIQTEILEGFEFALSSPFPEEHELLEAIYA